MNEDDQNDQFQLPAQSSAELKAIVEALIFASPDPLTLKAMCKVLDSEPKEDVHAALAELKQDYEPELEVDLFSLLSAFQAVVDRAKVRPRVLLPPEQISIEVRIAQLLERLSETQACGFEELFADVADRSGLIVTFLALLEMIRLKLIRVFQTTAFGPIRVYKRARPADAPVPIGDPDAKSE